MSKSVDTQKKTASQVQVKDKLGSGYRCTIQNYDESGRDRGNTYMKLITSDKSNVPR